MAPRGRGIRTKTKIHEQKQEYILKFPFPILNHILNEWQTSWNRSIGNKLFDKANLVKNNRLFEESEKKKLFWLELE